MHICCILCIFFSYLLHICCIYLHIFCIYLHIFWIFFCVFYVFFALFFAYHLHIISYYTRNSAGQPGYPALQLCLTSHKWGLRFVLALSKQEGHHFPIITPTGNENHETSIFNPFVILNLYSNFLFDSSFGVWFVTLDNYVGSSDLLDHWLISMKVILTSVINCSIPCQCAPDQLFRFACVQDYSCSVLLAHVLLIELEISSCSCKGNLPKILFSSIF